MKKVVLAAAAAITAAIVALVIFAAIAMTALSSTAAAAGGSGANGGCIPTDVLEAAGPAPTGGPTSAPTDAPPMPQLSPSSTAAATPAANPASTIPEELEVPLYSGTVTLDRKKLTIAAEIITVGRELGVSDQGLKVALMVALQESGLRMLANPSVPGSRDYPNDGMGWDHDSVNPFQQRGNWGTVAERMNLDYAIRAFYGGTSGPNDGTPAGLLDTPGWETMRPGVASQEVQVSKYPDAYDKWEPAADVLLTVLGDGIAGAVPSGCGQSASGTIDGEMALPLDQPYNWTSGYGPRVINVADAPAWHAAIDLQNWPNNCGSPVYAILPGKVTLSSALWLSVQHPDGFVVSYLHMYKSERLVDVGDQVTAGQRIGAVGNVPPSGGCHLDLRVNVAENTNPEVAKLVLSQNETRIPPATLPQHQNFVNTEEFMRLWDVEVCPPEWCNRDE